MAFNPWQPVKGRPKSYYIIDNVLSSVVHGIGFGLSIAGLVILVVRAAHSHSALRVTTFAIYGACMILLYLFSTLYHSLVFTKANKVFQIFDHSSIFIAIAGSYTPYTLVTIGGAKGWVMFGIIWALTVFGILYYIFNQGKHVIGDTVLYIAMGWMVILAGSQLYFSLGPTGFWLLVSGGIAYTFGCLFFSMRGLPYSHVIWHFFVLLGSILIFFSVLFYV